jgi:hypothetical protein
VDPLWWASGRPGVYDKPLGENPHVGLPDGLAESRLWGEALNNNGEFFVGRGVTGVGSLKEKDTPYWKQPQVGAVPPSWLGKVARLGWVRLD